MILNFFVGNPCKIRDYPVISATETKNKKRWRKKKAKRIENAGPCDTMPSAATRMYKPPVVRVMSLCFPDSEVPRYTRQIRVLEILYVVSATSFARIKKNTL